MKDVRNNSSRTEKYSEKCVICETKLLFVNILFKRLHLIIIGHLNKRNQVVTFDIILQMFLSIHQLFSDQLRVSYIKYVVWPIVPNETKPETRVQRPGLLKLIQHEEDDRDLVRWRNAQRWLKQEMDAGNAVTKEQQINNTYAFVLRWSFLARHTE